MRTNEEYKNLKAERDALAARVAEMREAIEESRRWHKGDKWRFAVDEADRSAWQNQMNVLENILATPDDSAAILARRDEKTILECADLSPNDLNISAGDSPAEVWIKFRDALRARAAELGKAHVVQDRV